MPKPEVTVAIIEDNGTRAELYSHWLEYMNVRVALTKQQILEAVDDALTVAIVAEEFGNEGTPEKVLELIRSRTRYCQVVTTSRDRKRVTPTLDVDNHLSKPIFEDDLTGKVERLARQTVFCEILEQYYRTSATLTTVHKSDEETEPEQVAALESELSDLKPMVAGLQAELDETDMAVIADLFAQEQPDEDDVPEQSSKYMPEKCYNCGRTWSASTGKDPSKGAVRLGSHVWRCTGCGHIQMGSSGGNPQLTHHSR